MRFWLTVFTLLTLVLQTGTNVSGQSVEAIVSVDFAQTARVKSVSGFLHGIEAAKPPDNLILPLKPQQWRVSETEPFIQNRVQKSGARIQLVLSDLWGYPGLNTNRSWAYENYAEFEDFVRQIARANKSPEIMWDVWNEPNDPRLPFWKGSFEQFCETYMRAYKILRRELGADAMIGGPSFSHYDKVLLTKFLNFCAANGCEVNFLSWHELDQSVITSIPERINEARRLFLDNPAYSGLKIKEIQINEIVGETAQYSPGSILGYFYYLEKGKTDGACKACWENYAKQSNCYNNSLDGLLTADFRPRASWWAYKIYADGAASRVFGTATNSKVAVLGSAESDTADKAQVLIGYFKRFADEPETANVTINLKNLNDLPFISGSRKARVKIEKIPNSGERAIQNLEVIGEKTYLLSGNSLQIALGKIYANEAYLVTVMKSL